MLMDGRAVSLPVDSASTSKEICQLLANKIKLTDTFGFSLYVTLYEKVHQILTLRLFVLNRLYLDRSKFLETFFGYLFFFQGSGSGLWSGAPHGCHLTMRTGSKKERRAGTARPLASLLPQGDLHPLA